MSDTVSLRLLDDFAAAFNRHDCDALMTMMTDDCIFDASAGDELYGTRFVGQSKVRSAFDAVFATFPDARWNDPVHFLLRNRGVTEWLFTGTSAADGKRTEVHGCDVFTFRAGKISIKDSYRKNRAPF